MTKTKKIYNITRLQKNILNKTKTFYLNKQN